MNQRLLFFLGLGLSQLLASCVVYMPMQCAAPQITDKKQGEISASSYLNGRYDLAGTYSPVRHLLVRAAYSNLRDDTKDSTYYRGHQYDLGVGTYWRAGGKWLLGGAGWAALGRLRARRLSSLELLLLPRGANTKRVTTRHSAKCTARFRPPTPYPWGWHTA